MNATEQLRAFMDEKGIDAVIVLDECNEQYLSGFYFQDGFLLITKTRAFLVTDFRYIEHASAAAYKHFEVVMPEDRTAWLSERFAEEKVKTVGMEGAFVPFATLEKYRKNHKKRKFTDIGNAIEVIRQIKTPDEIAKMQKAQDITDAAFSHILDVLNPDMTEIGVAAELEYFMRKSGAGGIAFDTIAVSGDASALPHGVPRNVKLKPGFLTMDFGAKFEGYCSDMTRTVVIGKATDEMRKVYGTVLGAQLAALDALREGSDGAEIDAIARGIIEKDYPGTFGHGLGHSVGLYIHETPGLNRRNAGRKMRAGEILTVEPGIYLAGRFGCRIEDMVAVEKNGVYNFTHSPKEMIEIY